MAQIMTMDEIDKLGIITLCKLVHCHSGFGNYQAAKDAHTDLKFLLKGMSHTDMVASANEIGIEEAHTGWLIKAWSENNGIRSCVMEFETAYVVASPGEAISYRRSKKSWGHLVSVTTDEHAEERAKVGGEAALRMAFHLKKNNHIRIKQTTRNELKLIIGLKLLSCAMRSRKDEFVQEVGKGEAGRIERITGLSVGKIWSSIRNGNAELIDRLAKIPNPKREAMRKRGMYVAPNVEVQPRLF